MRLLSFLTSASAIASLVLSSCSHPNAEATVETINDKAAPAHASTKADSLGEAGIQGHHFGEPLSNFPKLKPAGKQDENGAQVFAMPKGAESGWFGKHADQVTTFYQFQGGKFSMFRAVAYGITENRTALRQEARYLLGSGKDRKDMMSGLDWDGEHVLAQYTELLTNPIECRLEIYSKPLLAEQAAAKDARLKAENAAPAASK